MSRSDEIRLSIVIPVYGNWVDTLATLESLSRQECKQFEVLIADDGSPTPAPPEIHNFSFATYDRQPNGGFAVNCNRAAQTAIERGATHILFLNNDTDFSPQFAAGWLRAAAEMPKAMITPVIFWFKEPDSVWFSGGKMNMLTPFVRLHHRFEKTQPVDIICGCALLTSASSWIKVGGFDQRFAFYFEDFDLSLRAKALGIPVVVSADPDLRVWHKVSGSFRGEGAWKQQYLLLTARVQFVRRHYHGLKKALVHLLTCAHLSAMAIVLLPELPDVKRLWRAAKQGMAANI